MLSHQRRARRLRHRRNRPPSRDLCRPHRHHRLRATRDADPAVGSAAHRPPI